MDGLTIYKASAGSGKTYQLTADYLKLVFKPGNHFRHILAVTFTNKATAEMRERILAAIYELSQGKNSEYEKMLSETFGFSQAQIKTRASEILTDILHHYSFFNVTTIDSFFQGIIKSFARELGLNHSFSLELDMKSTLEKAIAQLFDRFMDEKEVTNWLSRYAFERMQDGKGWDVQKSLEAFAGNTFSEGFYAFGIEQMELLSDMERFTNYKNELDQEINNFMDQVMQVAGRAKKMMDKAGLKVTDFAYKEKGPAGFIIKHISIKPENIEMPGARSINACQSAESWTTKNSPLNSSIIACAENGLMQDIQQLVTLLTEKSSAFFTAREIRKNINAFALSARIYKQLIEYCNEQDIFLLGLATPFLSRMIGQDDAPFIYEKTGNYLHHFMIDEFQDTSELNWHNFMPLLKNSLSQGWPSLIVGDVKQAIYRWRNGNWALLDHVVQQQLKTFGTIEINLPWNYRSAPEVVNFNNRFFHKVHLYFSGQVAGEVAEGFLSEEHIAMFDRTFGQATQKLPDKKFDHEGFVSAIIIETKEKDEARSEVAKNIIEEIEQLAQKGYKPGDMAILVRRNSDGAFIATKLMEARIKYPEKEALFQFVSNDSIFLGGSPQVQLIIAALKFLIDPKNAHAKGELIWHYHNLKSNQKDALTILNGYAQAEPAEIIQLFPAAFANLYKNHKYLNITSLVNQLIEALIDKPASVYLPYLNALEDEVYKFNQNEGSNLSRFIEWWDEKGQNIAVALDENRDAIRIMTIHKAKGLQFNVVFLPFVQWDFNQRDTLLWCKPDSEPFNAISPVPVRYSKAMQNTIFKNEYYNEKFLALTDNLNLLYVAFTRAVNAMYIYAQVTPLKDDKNHEAKNAGRLLIEVLPGLADGGFSWNETEKKFSAGHLQAFQSKLSETRLYKPAIKTLVKKARINIKHHAPDFFSSVDDQNPVQINQGTLLHHIFEYIKTLDDIEPAIERMVLEGLIERTEKETWKVKVQQLINQPQVKNWFMPGWQVLTEQSIMLADGEVKRPDRILSSADQILVIDYKFVAKPLPDHERQLREYMVAISQIEKKPVYGYIWYALIPIVHKVA